MQITLLDLDKLIRCDYSLESRLIDVMAEWEIKKDDREYEKIRVSIKVQTQVAFRGLLESRMV